MRLLGDLRQGSSRDAALRGARINRRPDRAMKNVKFWLISSSNVAKFRLLYKTGPATSLGIFALYRTIPEGSYSFPLLVGLRHIGDS